MICQNCGHNNDMDATFCEKCGANLGFVNSQKPTKQGINTTNKILIVVIIVLIASIGIAAGTLMQMNKGTTIPNSNNTNVTENQTISPNSSNSPVQESNQSVSTSESDKNSNDYEVDVYIADKKPSKELDPDLFKSKTDKEVGNDT